MNILYISPGVAPYRDASFNLLGKKCSLDVIYEAASSESKIRNKEWFTDDFENYNAIFPSKIAVFGKRFLPGTYKYLLSHKYDVVVIGMYSSITQAIGIVFLKFLNRTYMINSDGGFVKEEESKFVRRCKRFLISGANGYLASGKKTAEYLSFYGADPKSIYIFPFSSFSEKDICNIPVDNNKKSALRKKLHLQEKFIVISIGQFIHRKGFDVLIKSAPLLSREIGIYIIGSDAPLEYIQLKDKLKADNIHFLPFMRKERLIEYYQAANVFVMPTREDIWGLVINEAMSQGLPVISTDKCLAALELIEEGKGGYIVPVDNSQKIAEKIKYLYEHPEICQKMSFNNIKKMKGYTVEAMAERFYKIFQSVMEDSSEI